MTQIENPSSPPPPRRPPAGPGRRVFAVVSSPRLAIALLVTVLACCVVGVTVFTGERAWSLIFNTLWFNGLLVLLALSSGLTFFPRIWGRKLSLISVGMIVFHVCFLTMLGGVVYNSLFHFKGLLRLTEGETLSNRDPESYDTAEAGRFFDFASLRGETTLVEMHRGYKVDGQDKRAAYEIMVGEGTAKVTATIYMTQNLDYGSTRYLVAKEGYSIGVVLHDRERVEKFAAMVPLQSLPKGQGAVLYTTGTSTEPGAFLFPPPPNPPALLLQIGYVPDDSKERGGQVEFFTWPVPSAGGKHAAAEAATEEAGRSGRVAIGRTFDAGEALLEAREVRYWVGMTVRRDPGLLAILTSLWAGLAGMTMTFVGRILQDGKRARLEASRQQSEPKPARENP
jgi:hypothetical protein